MLNPQQFAGKSLLVFGSALSLNEIAKELTGVLKTPIHYREISPAEWIKEAEVREGCYLPWIRVGDQFSEHRMPVVGHPQRESTDRSAINHLWIGITVGSVRRNKNPDEMIAHDVYVLGA
jgi:hypothetical protein